MEINNNRHNILSSNIAPNPQSVKYWADLSADPSGSVIKTFKDGRWTAINNDEGLDADITNIEKKVTNLESAVNNKVDKVSGKGLSTNDYTTQDKDKLSSLNNYNDIQIKERVSTLESTVAGLHNYDDTEVRELVSALTLKVGALEERIEALETPIA